MQSYIRFDGKFCAPRSSTFATTLDKAKEVCSLDPKCNMFYDLYGTGTIFYHCSGPSARKLGSGSGSVVHERAGKYKSVGRSTLVTFLKT